MAHAGGKVILVGEHAVVYGVEAVAVGLDRGVEAHARLADACSIAIDGKPLDAENLTTVALEELRAALGAPPCHIEVELQMPAGVGLGASAAIGVAAGRALGERLGRTLTPTELLDAVGAWERVFHGNPSGIDAACAALGGCIRFRKGRGPEPLPLASSLELVIAVASPPSSTREMVARVAALRERDATRFDAQLQRIADFSRRAELCLAQGQLAELGAILAENHQVLVDWDLSTPEIERARQVALEAGALGCKVTGAGGGGCIVALCPNAGPAPLVEALRRAGFTAFSSRVAAAN